MALQTANTTFFNGNTAFIVASIDDISAYSNKNKKTLTYYSASSIITLRVPRNTYQWR